MARNYHLTGLESASVWENFYAISQIPRETGNPEGITSYLLDFCKAHGIEAYRDEAYNVIARVPATPGYENASPVILHSHSDMVCIKDEGVDHDFAKAPIRVYAEGDVVTAEGTTLGGDDGIGVAFMMAYMTDKQAKHPALECVFTADEETTMNGGIHLDYSQFKAKYYVNLDGFGFAVGSAGEIDARVLMPRGHEPVRPGWQALCLKIEGLHGGHSGNQALLERANAIILLDRLLLDLEEQSTFQLITAKGGREGGCMATAIAATASAIIAVPDTKAAETVLAASTEKLKKEYSVREPNMSIAALHPPDLRAHPGQHLQCGRTGDAAG